MQPKPIAIFDDTKIEAKIPSSKHRQKSVSPQQFKEKAVLPLPLSKVDAFGCAFPGQTKVLNPSAENAKQQLIKKATKSTLPSGASQPMRPKNEESVKNQSKKVSALVGAIENGTFSKSQQKT